MQSEEYAVRLTMEGEIMAWELAMSEYTRGLSGAERGLVMAATAFDTYGDAMRAVGDYEGLARQWWDDLESLPRGPRFVVLTRLARAGVPEPQRLWEAEA